MKGPWPVDILSRHEILQNHHLRSQQVETRQTMSCAGIIEMVLRGKLQYIMPTIKQSSGCSTESRSRTSLSPYGMQFQISRVSNGYEKMAWTQIQVMGPNGDPIEAVTEHGYDNAA